jgi:hypothetical protein
MAKAANRLSFLAAAFLLSGAWAAPLQVRSEGTAVVVKGNKTAALEQATRSAQTNAVAEALTQLGGSADAAEGLLDKAPDLLKSFEVTEQNVDTNILTIKATASIDATALAARAGLKPGAKRAKSSASAAPRKVLILASEQLGPKSIIAWSDLAFSVGPGSVSASSKGHLIQLVDELGGLQATLSQAFTSAGYEVVDLKALRGKIAKPQLEVVDLTAPQAQELAKKGDADLVVVAKGRANSMYHSTIAESGMRSGGGNVVAQLIRVADGKVLSSTTQQGAKVHLDQETAQVLALNEAGKLASTELLRSLNP